MVSGVNNTATKPSFAIVVTPAIITTGSSVTSLSTRSLHHHDPDTTMVAGQFVASVWLGFSVGEWAGGRQVKQHAHKYTHTHTKTHTHARANAQCRACTHTQIVHEQINTHTAPHTIIHENQHAYVQIRAVYTHLHMIHCIDTYLPHYPSLLRRLTCLLAITQALQSFKSPSLCIYHFFGLFPLQIFSLTNSLALTLPPPLIHTYTLTG